MNVEDCVKILGQFALEIEDKSERTLIIKAVGMIEVRGKKYEVQLMLEPDEKHFLGPDKRVLFKTIKEEKFVEDD